jgi:CRISPR-associated endoribonuclease Cas6/Csy4 subtype I-F
MHMITCTFEPNSGLAPGPVFGLALSHLHLHHAQTFGIAFPDARQGHARDFDQPAPPSLGGRLQVFGEESILEAARKLLLPLGDYLHVGRVRLVKQTAAHLVVQRKRALDRTPAYLERALRRAIRKAEENGRPLEADIVADRWKAISEVKSTFPADRLPYLTIRSHSTCSKFILHFDTETVAEAKVGRFDAYGFSKDGTTVPKVG